jgi:hypothetical protein
MTTRNTRTKSPATRAADVQAAADQLPAALADAMASLRPSGAAPDPASWELVEQLGATIHRQARLLAGKSRGG